MVFSPPPYPYTHAGLFPLAQLSTSLLRALHHFKVLDSSITAEFVFYLHIGVMNESDACMLTSGPCRNPFLAMLISFPSGPIPMHMQMQRVLEPVCEDCQIQATYDA